MGQNRLMELTTELISLDGPIAVSGFLSSLKDSDMYLLLRYIKSSKYEGMKVWEALVAFSSDYLNSKKFFQAVNEKIEKTESDEKDTNNLFSNNIDLVFAHYSSR